MCDNANSSYSTSSYPIDIFYNSRKNLFDICGNTVNNEKYPFIDILSTYLIDIVDSIDVEIKKSTRNSIINWKEKKNPKLLSKFINSDDNINVINRSMNKITGSNYLAIVSEITNTLLNDNFRKLPDYSKFLFDTTIKKCLVDENFVRDYMAFITAFGDTIGTHIFQEIGNFNNTVLSLLEKNNPLKEFIFSSYIKDVLQYYNIGIIFGNLLLIQDLRKVGYLIKNDLFNDKFMHCLKHIYNFLDWMPVDMNELFARIYLVFGIINTLGTPFLIKLKCNDLEYLNEILDMIYNCSKITNKIKFRVLDMKDMIKNIDKHIPEDNIQTTLNVSIDNILFSKTTGKTSGKTESILSDVSKSKTNYDSLINDSKNDKRKIKLVHFSK